MATYTLSHTGAEVDAAVTNATNLFTTAHTWTADQTFGNITIQTGGLTVAEINTDEATIELLRVDGAGASAVFNGGATFNDYVIVDTTGSLEVRGVANFTQNIAVTGDVTAGSATINGETDISDDLIVTGDVNVGGELTASMTASDDLDMNGYNITGATEVLSVKYLVDDHIQFAYSGSGIASAAHGGIYVASSGTITPFNATDAIPSSCLVIYFI